MGDSGAVGYNRWAPAQPCCKHHAPPATLCIAEDDLILSNPLTVRALRADDLPELLNIQLQCYEPHLVESAQVYARRLASPANCSLVSERDGRVNGYLASYRSQLGKLTPLHGAFDGQPASADTLYLHDVAVLPACAGQGIAHALLARLWAQGRAAGLRNSALVSVQGSQDYWSRHGYVVQQLNDGDECARLRTYGGGAVYMVRRLD